MSATSSGTVFSSSVTVFFLSSESVFTPLFASHSFICWTEFRVFQSCLVFHGCHERCPAECVEPDGVFDNFHIEQDAPVVDLLVEPQYSSQIKSGTGNLDSLYCMDISASTSRWLYFFERFPLFRIMLRQVPSPPAVGFRGGAGLAEIPYQCLAFLHFLFFQSENCA